MTAPTNDDQSTCISNCHDKTYRAFDMYMQVYTRMAAKRNYRNYVDLSKYTGMEVEHQHDTESAYSKTQGYLHLHPNELKDDRKHIDQKASNL